MGWALGALCVGLGVLAAAQARAFPDSLLLGPAPAWFVIGGFSVVGVVYVAWFLLANRFWTPGHGSPGRRTPEPPESTMAEFEAEFAEESEPDHLVPPPLIIPHPTIPADQFRSHGAPTAPLPPVERPDPTTT